MKREFSAIKQPPVILVSPNIEKKGDEFGDVSTSLSETYQQALLGAGAIPLALSASTSRELIRESVSHCDGVPLMGGEDVDSSTLGDGELRRRVRGTVRVPRGVG